MASVKIVVARRKLEVEVAAIDQIYPWQFAAGQVCLDLERSFLYWYLMPAFACWEQNSRVCPQTSHANLMVRTSY